MLLQVASADIDMSQRLRGTAAVRLRTTSSAAWCTPILVPDAARQRSRHHRAPKNDSAGDVLM